MGENTCKHFAVEPLVMRFDSEDIVKYQKNFHQNPSQGKQKFYSENCSCIALVHSRLAVQSHDPPRIE